VKEIFLALASGGKRHAARVTIRMWKKLNLDRARASDWGRALGLIYFLLDVRGRAETRRLACRAGEIYHDSGPANSVNEFAY
jgi:hypothetical protein